MRIVHVTPQNVEDQVNSLKTQGWKMSGTTNTMLKGVDSGRHYLLVGSGERLFSCAERVSRFVLGLLAVIATLGFALLAQSVRDLFIAQGAELSVRMYLDELSLSDLETVGGELDGEGVKALTDAQIQSLEERLRTPEDSSDSVVRCQLSIFHKYTEEVNDALAQRLGAEFRPTIFYYLSPAGRSTLSLTGGQLAQIFSEENTQFAGTDFCKGLFQQLSVERLKLLSATDEFREELWGWLTEHQKTSFDFSTLSAASHDSLSKAMDAGTVFNFSEEQEEQLREREKQFQEPASA